MARMATAKKRVKQSGPTWTYGERKAKGRPSITLTLSRETVQILAEDAAAEGISKSALVEKLAAENRAKKK